MSSSFSAKILPNFLPFFWGGLGTWDSVVSGFGFVSFRFVIGLPKESEEQWIDSRCTIESLAISSEERS